MRRRALALLAVAIVATSGCVAEDSSGRHPASASPTTARGDEDPVATTLDDPVPPGQLPGNDEELVERATANLEDADIELGLEDAELVARARTFCSILSGGGMVAAKVDVWAGTIDFYEGSAEVFDAALDTYCPELRDGYTQIREGDASAGPTTEERGDLARFFLEMRESDLSDRTDGELSRDAAAVCLAPSGERWLLSRDVRRTLRPVARRDQVAYLFALTLSYCDERLDQLFEAVGATDLS
jgi:hypothetical protein